MALLHRHCRHIQPHGVDHFVFTENITACRTAAHTSLIDNGPVSATSKPRSAGFRSAALSGEDNADEIRIGNDGRPLFLSNNAGGILGGISTGQDIVVRFAVKPTSSILTPRRSIDRFGREVEVVTKGRHDPCVGIPAVPVGEAMMAVVLADHLLRQRALTGRDGEA